MEDGSRKKPRTDGGPGAKRVGLAQQPAKPKVAMLAPEPKPTRKQTPPPPSQRSQQQQESTQPQHPAQPTPTAAGHAQQQQQAQLAQPTQPKAPGPPPAPSAPHIGPLQTIPGLRPPPPAPAPPPARTPTPQAPAVPPPKKPPPPHKPPSSHKPSSYRPQPGPLKARAPSPHPPPPARGRTEGEDEDEEEGELGAADGSGAQRAQHAQHARQATGATPRLHVAALSGLLWHAECQQLQAHAHQAASWQRVGVHPPQQQQTQQGTPEPDQQQQQQPQQQQQLQQVPNNFEDVQQYVSVFEPLLHEEARGGLVNAYEEARNASKGWMVKVDSVEQRGAGWFSASILPMPGRQGTRGRHKEVVRKDSIMVLSRAPASCTDVGKLHRVACIVKKAGPMMDDPLQVSMHPCCPHHDEDRQSPCMRAVSEMLDHPFGWFVTPAGSLVTSEREVETLGRVGQGASGPMKDLIPMLLKPSEFAAQCDGQIAEEWPVDFGDPTLMDGFFRWLATAYDLPQRQAIVNASSHLAPPEQLENSPVPVLPFTLIQGPPGTGKTHTVKGILNSWYVVGYRRYHESWRREAAKQLAEIQASRAYDRRRLALEALDSLLPEVPKPKVLVCAPSNAATDELCERILKEGFRDLTTQFTFPDVARVGSEDAAMAESVKEVWTERRVQWHMNCSYEEYRARFFEADWRKDQAEQALEQLLKRLDSAVAASRVPGTEDAMLLLAGQMVDLQAARARAKLDQQRLNIVAPRFLPNSRFFERQAREELELSHMEHAELVFTTLSSTGRNVFSRLHRRHFDAVLIDEACQAAEVASLQPLVHGTRKVVMVGDPKQLPATLFSRTARDVLLERSLFERMAQSGVPVKLLAVQYRMHPEIRAFPSKFFYDNALQDAYQVVHGPPAPFYKSDILKPYVVFDVQHGAETSGQAGRSKINVAEARLAAGLFWELRCEMVEAWEAYQRDPAANPEPPPIEVGVVTPYKSQRDLLRSVFAELLGPDVASEVRIETVDSFQGKQLDVIILSCVRATPSGSGSIGFLADTRRMNVAITRAKRSLWVLGHAASLRCHNVWKELLEDAQERGCVVEEANADDPLLLPRFAELLRSHTGAPSHAHTLTLPYGPFGVPGGGGGGVAMAAPAAAAAAEALPALVLPSGPPVVSQAATAVLTPAQVQAQAQMQVAPGPRVFGDPRAPQGTPATVMVSQPPPGAAQPMVMSQPQMALMPPQAGMQPPTHMPWSFHHPPQ